MTVTTIRKDIIFHQIERSIRLFTLDEAGHAQIILGVNLSLHKLKFLRQYLIWFLLQEVLRNKLRNISAKSKIVLHVNDYIIHQKFEN